MGKKKKKYGSGFIEKQLAKKKKKNKTKEWRELRSGMIRVKAQENEALKMVDASLT